MSEIISCSNGSKGLEFAETGHYGLIILDWKIKNPSGEEIYNKIRKTAFNSATPIVLISGFVTREEIQICIIDRKAKFLVKPFTEEILLGLIQKVLPPEDQNKKAENPQNPSEIEGTDKPKNSNLFSKKNLETRFEKKIIENSGLQSNDLGLFIDKGQPIDNSKGLYVEKGQRRGTESYSENIDVGGDFEFTQEGGANTDSDARTTSEIYPKVGGEPQQIDLENLPTSNLFNDLMKSLDPVDSTDLNIDNPVIQNERKILSNINVLGKDVVVLAPVNILVVDSDLAMHGLLKSYLKEITDATPICVSNGREANEALNEKKFDLVVMDWNIKEIPGITLYNRIRMRTLNRDVPVVVLSGFVHKEDFRILSENANTQFLAKPTKLKTFSEIIIKVMNDAAERESAVESINSLFEAISLNPNSIINFANKLLTSKKNPSTYWQGSR